LREFVASEKRHRREERDRQVLAANRDRIDRDARMLVTEQAEL
jgi:hypothetical protein